MNNIMLHIHGACDRGAVPFLIAEMSIAFPQFFHHSLYLSDAEDASAVQMLNDFKIRTGYGEVSEDLVSSIDPMVIVLYDVGGDSVDDSPWLWLRKWPTISIHYSAVRPTVPCDLHVFVSDRMRGAYDNLVQSGFVSRWEKVLLEMGPMEGPWYRRKIDGANVLALRNTLSFYLLESLTGVHPEKDLTPKVDKPVISSVWGDRKPLMNRGVVVGCGIHQEWMLKWWWDNYRRHNDLPVLFVDMGEREKAMTLGAREWCESVGEVATLRLPLDGWFQKPFAFAQTIFEESLWMDVDCEVRGRVDEVFDHCKAGFAAAQDPYYVFRGVKGCFNSGVIAFRFGSDVVSEWCDIITKEKERYRDDQHVLHSIKLKDPSRISALPRKFNWLRLDGDTNPSAVCIHWTGPRGKEIVKAKMEGRYLREHFIEDLANTFRWKRGLEIGTLKGRTFLHLLEKCPTLELTTVDLWEPQPDNPGPEKYTPAEGVYKWDHEANEAYVREKAKKYGERAIIKKGDSREVVPDLPGVYDFVFLDGDHGSEAVKADILNAIVKLQPNGVLVGHDIDWPSVRSAVEKLFPGFMVGPDNIWLIPLSMMEHLVNQRGPVCPVGDKGVEGPTGL